MPNVTLSEILTSIDDFRDQLSDLQKLVGDVNSLITSNKSSLAAAINECADFLINPLAIQASRTAFSGNSYFYFNMSATNANGSITYSADHEGVTFSGSNGTVNITKFTSGQETIVTITGIDSIGKTATTTITAKYVSSSTPIPPPLSE